MEAAGLMSLAINSQTRDEASRLRNEELWDRARTEPNVIIAGPEQLKSKEFERAISDKEAKLYNRIVGTSRTSAIV
ncbi:hypothetical protein HGRIS_003313 [Hohenbuehelia grisea]|uniref:Uncharacterized protein n=1 Tax=Hohenbuehelia grisea TaxID=104357 RepID=A0ABR3JFS3_9AGAR